MTHAIRAERPGDADALHALHWMAYRLPAYEPRVRGAFRYAPAFAAAAG